MIETPDEDQHQTYKADNWLLGPNNNAYIPGESLKQAAFLLLLVGVLAISYLLFTFLPSGKIHHLISVGWLIWVAATGYLLYRLSKNYSLYSDGRKLFIDVIEASRGARLISDQNGRTVFINQSFKDLANQRSKPKPNHRYNISDLIVLFEEGSPHTKRFLSLVETGKQGNAIMEDFEVLIDHNKHWIQIWGQPLAARKGYMQWRVDDITTRYRMELALREEKEKLSDFINSAPIGIFSVDETGTFQLVNPTLARWLACDPEDLMAGEFKLHDFLVKPPRQSDPYIIVPGQDGAYQRGEIFMRSQDDRVFKASVVHAIIKNPNGSVITRSVVQDLTIERQWLEALRKSQDRFQNFFESAPLGIVLVDQNGLILEANDAFATMSNDTLDHIIETDILSRLSAIEENKKITLADFVQQTPNQTGLEIRLGRREEDDPKTVQLYATRLIGSQEYVLHFVDITEQRSLEKQFAQGQKMQAVGQLAGGVAHDFNNLLTAMIGFCDLLLLRHSPGDPSFNDIMQVKQNANRASNLVRQLLAFSRQQVLQPKVIDVADIVTELSHLLKRLIGAEIEFQIIHDRDLGWVKVDKGQLEQVLINLVVNARDAINGPGKITLKTRNVVTKKAKWIGEDKMPAGSYIAIDVIDNGPGIPGEVLKHIFDPFFTTKPVGKGTGLGLSTVYGIVRQTGGYVACDTKTDKGTTFTIFLLQVEDVIEEQKALPDNKKVEDLTGSARILLVEDEYAVRSFAMRALTNKGYDVIEAATPQAALDKLDQITADGTLDLLITDIIMPQMDGFALATKILEKFPNLPIIYMSGYTEDKYDGQLRPKDKFLSKPFSLKTLAETVKTILT